jgi:hypothetical protein
VDEAERGRAEGWGHVNREGGGRMRKKGCGAMANSWCAFRDIGCLSMRTVWCGIRRYLNGSINTRESRRRWMRRWKSLVEFAREPGGAMMDEGLMESLRF